MITAAASPDLVRMQHEQRLLRSHRLRAVLAVQRLAHALRAQRLAEHRLEAARASATLTWTPGLRVAVR